MYLNGTLQGDTLKLERDTPRKRFSVLQRRFFYFVGTNFEEETGKFYIFWSWKWLDAFKKIDPELFLGLLEVCYVSEANTG